MTIDYHIFIPLIPFVLGIFLKILLDFNLATFLVKYFFWIPMRPIFRLKVNDISGCWTQLWENEKSEKYKDEKDRKSMITIRQFGKYCYGEFKSGKEKYYIFGEITDKTIIGKWADCISSLGYYGSFELRIVDNDNLKGVWLGHSNEDPSLLNSHEWKFWR